MKSDIVLLYLSLLCITFLLVDTASAQRPVGPYPRPETMDPPRDWRQWIVRNHTFRAGGAEAGISTYNYYIGVPVFWIQNQLKLVPQMSLYWRQPESWRHQVAYGGRVLYFVNNQYLLERGDMNPYLGGFTAIAGRDHNTGNVVGVEPFISRYLKIGLELQAGLRSHYGEYKGFTGAGGVVGFSW